MLVASRIYVISGYDLDCSYGARVAACSLMTPALVFMCLP